MKDALIIGIKKEGLGLQNVLIEIETGLGTTLTALTDSQGQAVIQDVPWGEVKLKVHH